MMDRHSYLLLVPLSCAIWLQCTPETYATIVTGSPPCIERLIGRLNSLDTTPHDLAISYERGACVDPDNCGIFDRSLCLGGIDQFQRDMASDVLAPVLSVAAGDLTTTTFVCATAAQVSSELFPFERTIAVPTDSLFPFTAISRQPAALPAAVRPDFMSLPDNLQELLRITLQEVARAPALAAS